MKILFGIGTSFLFVIGAIWLVSGGDGQPKSDSILLLRKVFGIAGILFFGTTAVFGIKRLFDKSLGLMIDQQGITDHSTMTSVGLIEWADITGIRTEQVMSTKFLLIDTANPEKYMARATSGMKAKLMKSNMSRYGTPLSITSNTLDINFEDLEHSVQVQFQQHKSGQV